MLVIITAIARSQPSIGRNPWKSSCEFIVLVRVILSRPYEFKLSLKGRNHSQQSW
ncbi:MAG: hypothetical protein HC866_03885 [Leptolyngbyaceae cyanobacterium RU_5_1]|nr:hypothetical protein [Leptolyngbyaceae cyanobacterium RU_5_1]